MAFSYDPNQAQQVSDNDILPAGEYKILVTGVEDRESRNGGNYLKLTLTVIDGRYKSFQIFDNINYNNSNPKAVEMAYRTLKRISKCIWGRDDQPFSSQDLIGKKLTIQTKIEENGDFQNARVKNYVLPSAQPTTNQTVTKKSYEDDLPF